MDVRETAFEPSRRQFLELFCSGCVGALLVGAGASLLGCDTMKEEDASGTEGNPGSGITIQGNTIRLDLTASDVRPLASAGGFLFIRSARVIAINVDGTRIRAFSSICPHQGCDVDRFQEGVLICPCHDSRFNTAGGVVRGPAPGPLREYGVSRSGDIVVITKS
jgi:cytochrome b6-f complex iron-sulfur subunit|nr:MAG: hypothetical protein KatS3mg041_1785 [Bacteroidota bacterium]